MGAARRINGRAVKVDTISQEIGDARDQDVNYKEVLRLTFTGDPAHKLRVRIRSNSYDFQCYSIIDRWDGAKWHQVHALQVRTTQVGMARRGQNYRNDEFAKDRDELVRVAKEVLAP